MKTIFGLGGTGLNLVVLGQYWAILVSTMLVWRVLSLRALGFSFLLLLKALGFSFILIVGSFRVLLLRDLSFFVGTVFFVERFVVFPLYLYETALLLGDLSFLLILLIVERFERFCWDI